MSSEYTVPQLYFLLLPNSKKMLLIFQSGWQHYLSRLFVNIYRVNGVKKQSPSKEKRLKVFKKNYRTTSSNCFKDYNKAWLFGRKAYEMRTKNVENMNKSQEIIIQHQSPTCYSLEKTFPGFLRPICPFRGHSFRFLQNMSCLWRTILLPWWEFYKGDFS